MVLRFVRWDGGFDLIYHVMYAMLCMLCYAYFMLGFTLIYFDLLNLFFWDVDFF